jgi:hypothetical protein
MNKIKRKGEKKQEAEVMSERCWLYLRDLLKELLNFRDLISEMVS